MEDASHTTPTPDPSEAIVGSVLFGDRVVEGSIVRITHHGCVLDVPAGSGREIPLLDDVRLRLSGGRLGEPAEFPGRLSSWRALEKSEHVEIEVADEEYAALQTTLQSTRSVRIPVVGRKAVRARIQPLAGGESADELESAILDVSAQGLALIVSGDGDRALCASQAGAGADTPWRIAVAFKLPGNHHEVELVGRICYRKFTRKCVKYGVRFDEDATAERFPESRLAAVGEQIMVYQQGLLGGGKGLRAA